MTNTESAPALKPCPFCGEKPEQLNVAPDHYSVQCPNEKCCARITGWRPGFAIAAWNLRSGDRDATIEECAKVALADYPLHASVNGYTPGIKIAIAWAIRALRRAGETT